VHTVSRATDSPRNSGLGRFLEGWWNDYARSLRRRRRTECTIGAYRRLFEDFWRFQLGQGVDDPAKVTRDDVNRWTDNLTSRSRRDAPGPMSASTAEALGRYVRRARNRHAHADLPALWLGRRGALTARGIARMLDRRCDQAGVGHINPYRTTGAAWPATSTPWPTASSRWLPARWAAASSPA
jgi:site-specific recombinase XerD